MRAKTRKRQNFSTTSTKNLKETRQKKTLLKTIWGGVVAFVPVLATIADIGEKVSKIIG
jgi:hypothetical protein